MSKNVDPGASLELLLDTICNTFGGIIFIAILTAILLQMSGQPATSASLDTTRQQMASLQIEHADVSAQLATLREAVSQQDAMINRLIPPNARDQVGRLLALRRLKSKVNGQRLAALGQINQREIEIGKVAADLEALDRALTAGQKKVTDLQRELEKERAARTQDVRLPMLHSTDKREVPVFLTGGRFSVLLRPDELRSINTNDFETKALGTGHGEVRPKPGAGIVVKPAGATRDGVKARIAGFDKEREYLAAFVSVDSFDHFRELRNVMVEQGFEYRLIPLAKIDTIHEGRGNSLVQ